MYCPYTNTSPPECFVNRVDKISDDLKEMIREALENEEKRHAVECSDGAWNAWGAGVKILHEDKHRVTVLVSAGGSYTPDIKLVITIPRIMLS